MENKEKDLQILDLSCQNESLIDELNESLNVSKISKSSKTSKYPEVECPHFKNGGKCKNCIVAWKKSQKDKSNLSFA